MKKSIFFFLFSFLFLSVTSLIAQDFSVKSGEVPTRSPQAPESVVVLQWDSGVNFDAIGLTSGGTFQVSARFPASVTGPYTGYNMTQMEIYINDLPTNCTLKIYDQGTSTSPGPLLLSQDVTSSVIGVSWNLLTLSTPIPITGNDIWVGYEVTHPAGQFPCGVDAGPAVVDGDWIYLSPGPWQRLSVIAPTLNYNWNIHANLEEPPNNIFFDDFDSYIAGQQLACQNPTDWTTWNQNPCDPITDAYVSSTYAYSGANSVLIVQNTASGNDLIKPLGTQTAGKWYISFLIYIPAGKSGYFNTMNDFYGTTQVWGHDCFFDEGGAGRLDITGSGGGGTIVTFSWAVAQWNQVLVVVDLDSPTHTAEFWIGTDVSNFTQVTTWDWTNGGAKPNTLDVSDFYGFAATNEMYFDNYYFGDVMPPIIPVELTSFTANVNNSGNVVLNWSTATETNNQGFEIERRAEDGQYFTIDYVEGHGTTTEPQNYTFVDKTVEIGKYFYRLKQMDFDGRYEYSDVIEVDVNGVLTFNLEQNYPNPFNPSTKIKYSIPEAGNIKLSVYNVVGEEVAELINGYTEAGTFDITFDASNMPSGVYLYKLQSANTVQTRKMMLLK